MGNMGKELEELQTRMALVEDRYQQLMTKLDEHSKDDKAMFKELKDSIVLLTSKLDGLTWKVAIMIGTIEAASKFMNLIK